MTQSRFSELLMMDTQSYADLEHTQSFCCKDVDGLVKNLRRIVLEVYDKQSNAS